MNKKGKGCQVKTIEQLKILFSPRNVLYNLTKGYQVLAASVDYSRSSRRKPEGGQKAPPPREIGLGGQKQKIYNFLLANMTELLETNRMSQPFPAFLR